MTQGGLRLAVVVVSKGRAQIVGDLVASLRQQDRTPDEVWLSVPGVGDLPADMPGCSDLRVIHPAPGITVQRNAVLDAIDPSVDLLVFLDDDVVLHRGFLAAAEEFALARPDVALFTGRMVRDGAATGEVSRAEADLELSGRTPTRAVRDDVPAYGCNMVVRRSVAQSVRFDETLPLYGYLEDRDFGVRVSAYGALVEYSACEVIHLGAGSGRSSGIRLGFQQVVHPLYLRRKGTLTRRQAAYLVARVLVANLVGGRSARADRPGRLRGNLIGVRQSLIAGPRPAGVHDLPA